ncbi:MAG: hypothetical protein ACK4WH_02800 [Phycisphaerales bacterium]
MHTGAPPNHRNRPSGDRVAHGMHGGSPFIPECPACGYELTGLPDGPCPECGTGFTLDALRRAWLNPPARAWTMPPFALMILSYLLCLFPPTQSRWSGRADADYEPFVIIMVLLLAGLWAAWRFESLRRDPRHLLWLLPPIARSVWALCWFTNDAGLAVAMLGTMLGASALGVALFRLPRFTSWVIGAVTWVCLTLVAFVMLADAFGGLARVETWSDWPDPRPGQVHDQYPLRNDELLLIATVTLTAMASLAALLLWKRRWVLEGSRRWPVLARPAPCDDR